MSYDNQYEFHNISKKAKKLLNGPEGYEIDYKQNVSGIDSEDFVSFANSDKGGTILIGVKEVVTEEGRQKGKVVGCSIGDEEKLTILSKAESCIPPIDIEIIIENSNDMPFYRIEIPSGKDKPYCTSRGTYKIRGNGRNNALLPDRLLQIFTQSEGKTFLKRFEKVTEGLENNMEVRDSTKTIKEINNKVDEIINRLKVIEESNKIK